MASPGNEVRWGTAYIFPLLLCPEFLLGSKTVLICLHEFYRASGEIDENLIHVFLWPFSKSLHLIWQQLQNAQIFQNSMGARAPMPHG